MTNPVLCVSKSAVVEQMEITDYYEGNNSYFFEFSKIDPKHLHFLNRSVADGKDEINFNIAKQLPQVLPYVLVTCNGEVLTYSRAKGQEDRLHGNLSCGFGGHIDLPDINMSRVHLTPSIMRELKEELRIDDTKPFQLMHTDTALIDTTNEVGQVHLGILYHVDLSSKDMIDPDLSEIHLPEWKSANELVDEFKRYENWSQTVISMYLEVSG